MGCPARELIEVPERRLELVHDLEVIDAVRRGPRKGNREGARPSLTALKGGSPSPWTPAAIPNTLLWLGSQPGLTYAAQPNLVDGDMEAADTAAWTPYTGGVSSKSTATPYSGARCLRIDTTLVNHGVYQDVLVPGNRYAMSAQAAGDGTRAPGILLGGASVTWVGTSSASWQAVSIDATADGTRAYLVTRTAGAGFVRFDDMSIVNKSLSKLTPAYVAPAYAGTWLAQATATAQPWWDDTLKAARYQGGDLAAWTADKSAAKCLHDGTGGTLIVCVRPSVLNAVSVFFSTFQGGAATVGCDAYYTNANTMTVRVGNGTGALDLSLAGAVPVAINTTYVFTLRIASGANGVTMRQNSVNKLTGSLTAPSAADPMQALGLGASIGGSILNVDGTIPDAYLANRVLTDAECLQIERDMYYRATGLVMS